ncbi:hypothetical protein IC582_029690 [Cucumis melo]
MEYMLYVIKETLRLHPPAPLLVPRERVGDVEIEGCTIPSKSRVFVNVWAIRRDPMTWENPNEFIPERFRENFALIIKCAAISFAITSFEFTLAKVLYWFDWKLSDGCALKKKMDSLFARNSPCISN